MRKYFLKCSFIYFLSYLNHRRQVTYIRFMWLKSLLTYTYKEKVGIYEYVKEIDVSFSVLNDVTLEIARLNFQSCVSFSRLQILWFPRHGKEFPFFVKKTQKVTIVKCFLPASKEEKGETQMRKRKNCEFFRSPLFLSSFYTPVRSWYWTLMKHLLPTEEEMLRCIEESNFRNAG